MTSLLQIEAALSSIELPFPLLAFLAGIISILSPCILPLLPAILAYSTASGKFRPMAIVLGLAFTFTAIGMITASFSDVFFGIKYYINIIAEFVILVMGLIMLFEKQPRIFNIFSNLFSYSPKHEGIAGGFILGMSLGIVWIPCTGPILTTIIMEVLLKGGITYGGFLLLAYSLGLGLPMLLIAYSARISGRRMSTISRYDAVVKRSAGAILIIVALWLIYNNHIRIYTVGF